MLEAENLFLRHSDITFKKETVKTETLGCAEVFPKSVLDTVPREEILKEMALAFADKILQYAEIEEEPDMFGDGTRIFLRLQVVDRKRERT